MSKHFFFLVFLCVCVWSWLWRRPSINKSLVYEVQLGMNYEEETSPKLLPILLSDFYVKEIVCEWVRSFYTSLSLAQCILDFSIYHSMNSNISVMYSWGSQKVSFPIHTHFMFVMATTMIFIYTEFSEFNHAYLKFDGQSLWICLTMYVDLSGIGERRESWTISFQE